ncbi:MAG: hypothetical protein IIY55_12340 [Blautia sp.]|nr:hypothetical protein [Blautia sp.]
MSSRIKELLEGKGENYILPFFWQHGEDEAALRKYMEVIHNSNIGAVCVESRPHPDYCGPRWWEDMDVILDEAVKRDMKVWILDDSHFPTGYANGAMQKKPDYLRRQSITFRRILLNEGETLHLNKKELTEAGPYTPNEIEQHFDTFGSSSKDNLFADDRLLGILAVQMDPERKTVDLLPFVTDEGILWKPEGGSWKVLILNLTRNRGPHRDYINMMDRESVRVLIDTVYEPHYARYKEYFGTTIAGFFSDEPELGNGHLYEKDNQLGCYDEEDYPWSRELEEMLSGRLEGYPNSLALLWDNEADPAEKAAVRFTYMDCVTRLVEEDFSYQLGNWCRSHGVRYIGHLIEDNNQHARTGSSLGHFFRGLAGEDWAGIDDIGGQVLPQGEDLKIKGFFSERDGEFYHYMLGNLASSAAAIEPLKKGNSMCEVFGAYGWSEGVRLEKYLLDHFMVRGVNHFVPHAFSPKEFPDPDCPPHFYAHGHNPQYRHFGALMAYANRVCHLICGGGHVAQAAILYHGEGEWMGETTFSQHAARQLADAQIFYDFIPSDVFETPEKFGTEFKDHTLIINHNPYRAVFVPKMQFLTKAAAVGLKQLKEAGVPTAFVDAPAQAVGNPETPEDEKLYDEIRSLPAVPLEKTAEWACAQGAKEITFLPQNNRLRYLHYIHEDQTEVYLFVNEGTEVYKGTVAIPGLSGNDGTDGRAYFYDAWNNRIYAAKTDAGSLPVIIEPLHMRILVVEASAEKALKECGKPEAFPAAEKICLSDHARIPFKGNWKRSICRSHDYPAFEGQKEVSLPDTLEKEQPLFSGFVRYENTIDFPEGSSLPPSSILVITDASEGVELFVNGASLGIQIAPPFRYDLSGILKEGENKIVIETATTLEREMSVVPDAFGNKKEPVSASGLNGEVYLACPDVS